MAFRFFLSEFNATGLTGQVGGDLGAIELSGYLGELFTFAEAYPSETSIGVYQYRKIYLVNNYGRDCEDVRLWIDAEHVTGQIQLSLDVGGATTGSVNIEPTGLVGSWASPKNYSNGLSVGTMSNGDYKGVWLKQTLSGIESSNLYASFRLYAGGIL
jgi:hypothetical protein